MKNLILISILLILFAACEKPQTHSEIPEISFKKWTSEIDPSEKPQTGYKLNALFTVSVIDGDGDIGLADYDTVGVRHPDSLHYHDLFLKLDEKISGAYVEKTDMPIDLFFRTPFWDPTGFNKTLFADIELNMDYFYTQFFNADTIRFRIVLYDRELHKSNEIITPDLPLIGTVAPTVKTK